MCCLISKGLWLFQVVFFCYWFLASSTVIIRIKKNTLIYLALLGLRWCLNCSYGRWGLLSSCGVPASHCSGLCYFRAPALGHVSFSSCGTWALVALWHVESPRTTYWNCVPCSGRWIPNHLTTEEVPLEIFLTLFVFLNWLDMIWYSDVWSVFENVPCIFKKNVFCCCWIECFLYIC